MIELVSFSYVDGGDGVKIYAVRGEEKCTLTVSADQFLSLEITKGEVDDTFFIEIERAALHYRAYRSALRMLSFGQCSAKRLYDKLREKSFSHAAALSAVKKAVKDGYVDERRQIESYLCTLVEKKHCGRRKVVPFLLARGYKRATVDSVLDEKYTDSDFAKAKNAFLLKTFGKTAPQNPTEAAEMKKALYKQGF